MFSSLGMDSLMQLGLAINLLAQIPQATLSATKLYSKHPYLACFMFAAVLLVLLAFKVRGGGAFGRYASACTCTSPCPTWSNGLISYGCT